MFLPCWQGSQSAPPYQVSSWPQFSPFNTHQSPSIVLCRTQIFQVSIEYERRFSSIFEHEHHRALDIRTSSGTNIINSWNMCFKRPYHYVRNPQTYQKLQKVHLIRTSSEHEHTKNDTFELRAGTHNFPSGNERVSIGSMFHTTLKYVAKINLRNEKVPN